MYTNKAASLSLKALKKPKSRCVNRFIFCQGNLTSQSPAKPKPAHRGIFNVPVYRATIEFDIDFPVEQAEAELLEGETLLWEQAQLQMFLSSNRALRGAASLTLDGEDMALEPMSGKSGIFAELGDVSKGAEMNLSLGLNGAERLMLSPVGRHSVVRMTSDWADPSFTGAFLPDGSDISEAGFSAKWTIPHLARALPQSGRESYVSLSQDGSSFGVRLFEPNSFYQKAWRASKYGILFVALTFLTVLLVEGQRERPVHPVQYLLIGLAQATFTLLMLAYAEQIGFARAYVLAAGATVALLVLFGATGLKLGRRTWVLGGLLVLLYGVLYLILESTDFALIAGASLAFLALAATMIATRNEEWYGASGPGNGLFSSPQAAGASS